jgi:hypothetical protein
MQDDFSKVSSFYTKNGSKYEKKVCNFILKDVHTDVETAKQVLKDLEYDMSPFVKQEGAEAKINFGNVDGYGDVEVTI